MHRLLVASAELDTDLPVLSEEARDHLTVLRPKDGESVELFDGKGRWRVYEVHGGEREGGRRNFRLSPVSATFNLPHSNSSLTLFACVTKGARWDWTIEKATELGVSRIVPVLSERTIVRLASDECGAKRSRWLRIAEEAARQSDAKWIPEINEPVTFTESLALVRETNCFIGALTKSPPPMIGAVLADLPVLSSYALFVGPEGDFTPEELAALIEIATPVSFGSTILRAETAAIYGLSVLKAHLDSRSNLPTP